MSAPLRVGVVGLGVGVGHVRAFKELPELYSVEAVCDLDAARAQTVAKEHDVATAVTDFAALLKLDLDLISIATPPNLHYEQARDALAAGRHVVLEKPFVRSLAEADALAEHERASGRRLCPVFQYRSANGIAQLLHLREKGFAGKAYTATVETHWRRGPAYYDNPWRGRWVTELGGCLVSHAIHNHDLLTHVLGPVRSVYARVATRVNPIEVEDCAAVVLEMADGSLATLSATLGAEEDMSRLRFCFDGLTAESNRSPYNAGTTPWTFTAADPDRQKAIEAAITDVPMLPERNAGMFFRLHKALTEDGPMPVSIADARPSIELITAAFHSARTGEAVTLPLSPDHPLYEGWLPQPEKRVA